MISSLLDSTFDPRHVALELRAESAGEAIWQIIELLRETEELNRAREFFDAVMTREKKISSVAPGGVAFPHARTDLVERLLLGVGRSREGIPFGEEGQIVHLIFLIAVPQRMANDYLVCVGELARRLHRPATRAALLAALRPAEFFDRLRDEE